MKKIFFLFLVALMSLSVFTGCSKSASDATFIIHNGAEPESLDPALISGVPEHRIYMSLFEGLTTYDPKTAEPIPALAKSWDVSEDGLTYTFHLRDAKWSDGTPITANTFVDSWLRFLNPETAAKYAWMMTMIVAGADDYNSGKKGPEAVKIKAVDEKTFQVTLTGPAPYFIGMAAHYAFSIQPLHVIKEHGSKWTNVENIVTNGPFKLSEWSPQDKLVVVPNEMYWDKENVSLKKVIYLPIEDNNTAMNMFVNNELDWCTNLPSDRQDEGKAMDAYQNNPVMIVYYYVFNTQRKPFNDPRVRKALSMAISRKDVVEKITRKGDIPTTSMVPPMGSYKPAEGNAEDIEAAKKLLAEAGYPDGKGLDTITILYNTDDNHKKVAEYVQQAWENNLGVKVELENQEWKTYLKTREKGEFDVARAGWAGDYLDPNTFLELFIASSSMNGGKYNNPEFDRLIKAATKILDTKKRLETLRKAESLLINKDQAIMPFYYYSQSNLIDMDKWGGWYPNTLDIHPTKTIYLK